MINGSLDEIMSRMSADCTFVELRDNVPVFSGRNPDLWSKMLTGRECEVIKYFGGDAGGTAIVSLGEFLAIHPDQAEPLIDGLLRRGETMNIIAAPKVGKTWLAHDLARCVALGDPWLGFETQQSRVLIVDAELHPTELAKRWRTIAGGCTDALDMVHLFASRGRLTDIKGLSRMLTGVRHGHYGLIVVDALYRFLPPGCSENDNAAMMQVYNVLDGIASHTGAAIVVVHHSSKGDQGGKGVTDMGSGAGSIARATDTHLAIRPHEQEGFAVLQGVCRSFPAPRDISIHWSFPRWERSGLAPVLAMRQSAQAERQKRLDDEADLAIHVAIGRRWRSVSELRSSTGMGAERIERALRRLGAVKRVTKSKVSGKKCPRYKLPE